MTMIRINLIAERKAGAPKVAKKPSGQTNEIQENLILIVAVLVAFACCMFLWNKTKNELKTVKAEETRLKAEYDKVKHWQDKKEEFEIQKELLNEKIQRISELKDRREGPVKLMQDIANVLPESVWLESVSQGYDKKLLSPTGKGRARHSMPSSIGTNNLIKVTGFANSQEAITNFANKILSLDKFYHKTDLNKISRVGGGGAQEYKFDIWFEVKPAKKADADTQAETK